MWKYHSTQSPSSSLSDSTICIFKYLPHSCILIVSNFKLMHINSLDKFECGMHTNAYYARIDTWINKWLKYYNFRHQDQAECESLLQMKSTKCIVGMYILSKVCPFTSLSHSSPTLHPHTYSEAQSITPMAFSFPHPSAHPFPSA